MNWIKNDIDELYLYGKTNNFIYKKQMACFDVDGTIITTKSGKTFPINKYDWKLIYDINILKNYENTHCIIFISNQNGLKNKIMIDDWIYKINEIVNTYKLNICIYASINNNLYKKPMPTLWKQIINDSCIEYKNLDDLKQNIFYCGDAAGRNYNKLNGKHDFSDTDYKFALNYGVPFFVPEEIFTNDYHKYNINKSVSYVDLTNIKKMNSNDFITKYLSDIKLIKTMIIMIGYPGSGKSYISKLISNNNNNCIIICQDTFITKKKCFDELKISLDNNKSVIIDKLNYDKGTRKEYIDYAKRYNYNIIAIIMNTNKDLSYHNNMYRYWKGNNKISKVPSIVYNKYNSNFVKPIKEEGFNDIYEIDFTIITDDNYFDNDYYLYFD